MFPSTNMYYLTNNQKDSLNFTCKQLLMNISSTIGILVVY
ncbi:MAG: hypothetical protein CM15mV124_460 [uncultured marine virus]|nr:MAG: hypothetical protein CM15mV124_460 [uncultured marine virus]